MNDINTYKRDRKDVSDYSSSPQNEIIDFLAYFFFLPLFCHCQIPFLTFFWQNQRQINDNWRTLTLCLKPSSRHRKSKTKMLAFAVLFSLANACQNSVLSIFTRKPTSFNSQSLQYASNAYYTYSGLGLVIHMDDVVVVDEETKIRLRKWKTLFFLFRQKF